MFTVVTCGYVWGCIKLQLPGIQRAITSSDGHLSTAAGIDS